MSISFDAAYMRNYQAYQQAIAKAGASATSAVFSIQADEAAAAEESGDAAEAVQSLDEFKKDFYAFIDSVSIHPSQAQARRSVVIHDGAFEKMMNDPELKAKVEEQIKQDFAGDFGIATPAWTVASFDENGVYSGSAGGSAYLDQYNAVSANAFWSRDPVDGLGVSKMFGASSEKAEKKARKEKKREQMEQLLDHLAEKRRLQAQLSQELYYNKFNQRGDRVDMGTSQPTVQPISMFDVPL